MGDSKIWQFLAGLSVFIFGMSLLENALRQLTSRAFKLFLKKHTSTAPQAIISGTITAGVLQSSSLVSLIVLSFVGTRIISMRNALGVLLGANLGSTLSSWLVILLGFELNVEQFSYAIIAISGIGLLFARKHKKILSLSHFFFGFGLVFMGLNFMKISSEIFAADFFHQFFSEDRIIAVLVGVAMTVLVQTSSATMVIVLSVLYQHSIPFSFAVGIVTGAELGTSLKLIITSVGGIAAKKRVAAANIIFNLVVCVLATIFMSALIKFVLFVTQSEDYLVALVLYQTVLNAAGIIIFYPLLNYMGDWLEKKFADAEEKEIFFISEIRAVAASAAKEAFRKEASLFIYRVAILNLSCFDLEKEIIKKMGQRFWIVKKGPSEKISYSEEYQKVKQAEGEILSIYARFKNEQAGTESMKEIDRLISAVRNAMYSAKAMKDVRHDEKDLLNSSHDSKYNNYRLFRSHLREFYAKLNKVFELHERKKYEQLPLDVVIDSLETNYKIRKKNILRSFEDETIVESDISTMLNVNREMYSSCKSFVLSLNDFFSINSISLETEMQLNIDSD